MVKRKIKKINGIISQIPTYYCFAFKCAHCNPDEYNWAECDRLKIAGYGFITCYDKNIPHDCDCPFFKQKK